MRWAFLRGASGVWLRHLRVNKEVCDFLRDFPEEMQVGFGPGRKIERKRLIHDYNIAWTSALVDEFNFKHASL